MEVIDLKEQYKKIRPVIVDRISEFEKIWEQKDHTKIFHEFVFCLLTPQSKAKMAQKALNSMIETGIIYKGSHKDIEVFLKGVRFYKNKARYIEEARNRFFKDGRFLVLDLIDEKDLFKTREVLVKNIKGYGYKEASHFLRNIGLYRDIAILDRHIMKNMRKYGYIDDIPKSLTPKRYIDFEQKFIKFAKDINIPPHHLDLLLWYLEAGEVFK